MSDAMLAKLVEITRAQDAINKQLMSRIVDLEGQVGVLRTAFIHVAKMDAGEQAEAVRQFLRYFVAHSQRPIPGDTLSAAVTSAANELLRLLAAMP